VTAKYGASITQDWIAAFNTPYPNYAWSPTTRNNDKIISIDTMPGKNDSPWVLNGNKFNLNAFDFSTNKTQTMSYWLENYESETTFTYEGRTYGLYKTVTGKFNYIYDNIDFYNISGYTKFAYSATYYDWWGRQQNHTLGSQTPNAELDVDFYYNAQTYPLTFYDYDGSLISTQQVTLNSDISSYLEDNKPEAPAEGAEG
jgi:hypothetical protein